MLSVFANLNTLKRQFSTTFPCQRIGFHFPHLPQERKTFTGKLELCLRLNSSAEYAEDIIDGIVYKTPFPHAILKRPGQIHSYSVEKFREAVYIQYPAELESELNQSGLLSAPPLWEIELTQEIQFLLFTLHEQAEQLLKPGTIDRIDLLAMQLFEEVVGQCRENTKIPPGIPQKINRITSYFHLHFTEEIPLESLLRENGLSRRNFFRYWNRFHTETPAEYLRKLKLQHVCFLLKETSFPIHKIAEQVNIPNAYYLCRIFRRHFGMTPLQYRKHSTVISRNEE